MPTSDGHELRSAVQARGERQASPQAAAAAAFRASGGGVGRFLLTLGAVFSAVTLFGVVKLALGDTDTGGNAMMALPFAGVCLVFGVLKYRAGRRAAYLAVHGLRAVGTVVSLERTGMYSGGQSNRTPQFRVTLSIALEGHPPFEAHVKHYLDQKAREVVHPGAPLPVRVDPDDHASVQFDPW